MFKCDRCVDRLAQGEEPSCIEACPENVQAIGPRPEILEKPYALAREMGGYIYGDMENGGTNTLYVSPVPFESLNQTITQFMGMPDLAPKENAMAQGNALGASLFLAPMAGVAAAFGRFYTILKKQTSTETGHGA